MPRPVSRRMMNVLNGTGFSPVLLLDLTLVGMNPTYALRFTDAKEPVTWNGNTYQPMEFSRSALEERLSTNDQDVPAIVLTLNNVDSQLAALLSTAEVEDATSTLTLCDRSLLSNPRDGIALTVGEARDLTLSESTLTFQIVTVIGQQQRMFIPKRVYQAKCNYVFGAKIHCGIDVSVSPITIQTTVSAGTTTKYIVVPSSVLSTAGNPSDPTDFWDTGFIVMLDGTAGLQSRPIQRFDSSIDSQLRFYLRYPLLSLPTVGDPIALRRNCRRTKADCGAYHLAQNADDPYPYGQFGGYAEVPPPRFKPTKVGINGH